MRKSFAPAVAALAVVCIAAAPARADTLSAAVEAGTERDPSDFSLPVLNYDIATITKTYDNGLSWTGFLQNARPAHDRPAVWAFEGMLGYRYAYSPSWAFYGNIGAGERLSREKDFPYVTFRLGADHALGQRFVWNVLNLRYRNGLDPGFTYRASIAGTGLTYRVSDSLALYTRVFAAFDTEFRFAGTGLGIGVRRYF